MAASNAKVAEVLRRYAAALALNGADRFKVKAYRRAAETIETLDADVADLIAARIDLTTIPTVGRAISGAIREIVETGSMRLLDDLLAQTRPELVELATRPALDPKKVSRIYKKLGIGSLSQLSEKLASGDIERAFDSRMAFHVRRGLDERPRMLLYHAQPIASKIESYLKKLPGVRRVAAVGSLRRKRETVGDLNFLVESDRPAALIKSFAKFGGVQTVEQPSKTEATFKFSSGLSIRLACTRGNRWAEELLFRTGSADHVAELHQIANQKGVPFDRTATTRRRRPATETQIYRSLGLDYVEPELREGRGEVDAAAHHSLPTLVKTTDLRGDLHMHTTASDGANSIAEMAQAAAKKGYEYIAITDHSQSLKITNGLSEKRLLEQIKAIDQFNARQTGIVVLKSAEVDILADGSLDYSDAVLKELDFTICSIHSRFALNGLQQTERIMRAMDNRYFNIMGHPTGRLLMKREGYGLDMERLIEHAKGAGCYFEINSSPDRLDLSDEHAHRVKAAGIGIAVNTDAHSLSELEFITGGICQARRAWLVPADVLNTLPVAELLERLRR